jgi:hypothetical protein
MGGHLLHGHVWNQIGLRPIGWGCPCRGIIFGIGLKDVPGIALAPTGILAAVQVGWGLQTVAENLGCYFDLDAWSAVRIFGDLALLRLAPPQKLVTAQGRGWRVDKLLSQRSQHGHGFRQASA